MRSWVFLFLFYLTLTRCRTCFTNASAAILLWPYCIIRVLFSALSSYRVFPVSEAAASVIVSSGGVYLTFLQRCGQVPTIQHSSTPLPFASTYRVRKNMKPKNFSGFTSTQYEFGKIPVFGCLFPLPGGTPPLGTDHI